MRKDIEDIFQSSIETIKKSSELSEDIEKSIDVIVNSLKNGNKIILFGNGGSAADAQHISAELIGKYNLERESFPAISLTTDTSILTAVSNDYSYEKIFSRQCESLVTKGDVVIGISTSGNSRNVLNGLITSKKNNAVLIGLLGNNGGQMKNIVDIPLVVESTSTPRIQEAHRVIYHIICEMVEKKLVEK